VTNESVLLPCCPLLFIFSYTESTIYEARRCHLHVVFVAPQHAMNAERDIAMAYPSVCPSVSLSDQCRYSVKTNPHVVTLYRRSVRGLFEPHCRYNIPRETAQRALNTRGWENLAMIIFFVSETIRDRWHDMGCAESAVKPQPTNQPTDTR